MLTYFHKQIHKVQNHKGFNIISLIVVMAVLAILVTIAVPKYLNHVKEAQFTRLLHDGRLLMNAAEHYYLDYQDWPVERDGEGEKLPLGAKHENHNHLASMELYSLDDQETVLLQDIANEDYSNIYHLSEEKLSDYVRIQSGFENYVFMNPVGHIYIVIPATNPFIVSPDPDNQDNEDLHILTLEGTGLDSDPVTGLVADGTEITIMIEPPENAEVESFLVNGVNKINEIVNNQYAFTITEDTHIKVIYKDMPEVPSGPLYNEATITSMIEEGYIPIATAEELNSTKVNEVNTFGSGTQWENQYMGGLNKKYIQVANIDLSSYNSGEGWTPIGNYAEDTGFMFSGTFDGNGFLISNLKINRPDTNYQGLFGYVSEDAELSNIALKDIDITGKQYIGGLAGYNGGTIKSSHSIGLLTGTELAPNYVSYLGGLVGSNYGGSITSSYSMGSVTGGQRTGGLVGHNRGPITSSYSTSNVITDRGATGGLVGYNTGNSTITFCYSTGNVTGGSNTGGLVGWNYDGSITSCYSTGFVEGNKTSTGGLVGRNEKTVSSSYWNVETSGQTISDGGEGKSTAEMKQQSTFTDWNFNNTWQIQENVTYPYLRNNLQSPQPQ